MTGDHVTPIRCTICMYTTGGCDGSCRSVWPVGTILLPPKGCICPPGSEATCKRSDCGRKDQRYTTGTAYGTGETP